MTGWGIGMSAGFRPATLRRLRALLARSASSASALPYEPPRLCGGGDGLPKACGAKPSTNVAGASV